MTETEDEVKPLFWPGQSLFNGAKFICNINGELSIWGMGDVLRAYGEDGFGIWLDSEERIREHIAIAHRYSNNETIPAIARNAEAVLVYMRMLGVEP